MAYCNLGYIHQSVHTVCSNVLCLPPVICRIVQQTFPQQGAYILSMHSFIVYARSVAFISLILGRLLFYNNR